VKAYPVSITAPLFDGLRNAEDVIVYCARVSNPSNQLNLDTGAKLLRYCMNHGHWSVFEMADLTVGVETSRAVSAQLIRHRSLAVQEFSQRYSAVTAHEPVELRIQGDSKQGSSAVVDDDELGISVCHAMANVEALYQKLLDRGVSRETARMILPMATRTHLYVKGSVRSWIHYLKVRLDSHTQKEHRLLAEEIRKVFVEHFPICAEAAELHTP
jgi:thymidylate synthase (FAD)